MRKYILCLLTVVLASCQAEPSARPKASADAQSKPGPALGAFVAVGIESHPRGWGSAYKTVRADGVITGGHMSGSPDSPLVHMDEGRASAEDLAALRRHVEAVRRHPPAKTACPNQESEGYKCITIAFDDRNGIAVYAAGEGPFPSADWQAIWDLLVTYRVGAW